MKTVALLLALSLFGCAAPLSTHVTYTTHGTCDFGLVRGQRVQVRSEDGDKTVVIAPCPSEVALLSY